MRLLSFVTTFFMGFKYRFIYIYISFHTNVNVKSSFLQGVALKLAFIKAVSKLVHNVTEHLLRDSIDFLSDSRLQLLKKNKKKSHAEDTHAYTGCMPCGSI